MEPGSIAPGGMEILFNFSYLSEPVESNATCLHCEPKSNFQKAEVGICSSIDRCAHMGSRRKLLGCIKIIESATFAAFIFSPYFFFFSVK